MLDHNDVHAGAETAFGILRWYRCIGEPKRVNDKITHDNTPQL